MKRHKYILVVFSDDARKMKRALHKFDVFLLCIHYMFVKCVILADYICHTNDNMFNLPTSPFVLFNNNLILRFIFSFIFIIICFSSKHILFFTWKLVKWEISVKWIQNNEIRIFFESACCVQRLLYLICSTHFLTFEWSPFTWGWDVSFAELIHSISLALHYTEIRDFTAMPYQPHQMNIQYILFLLTKMRTFTFK